MESKQEARLRRAKQTRKRIALIGAARLCVHRTNSHIYANIYDSAGGAVIAAASTLDAAVKTELSGKSGGNAAAAVLVGKEIAKKAIAAGVVKVAFDRSGFAYHGRIKQLADSAREAGLQF